MLGLSPDACCLLAWHLIPLCGWWLRSAFCCREGSGGRSSPMDGNVDNLRSRFGQVRCIHTHTHTHTHPRWAAKAHAQTTVLPGDGPARFLLDTIFPLYLWPHFHFFFFFPRFNARECMVCVCPAPDTAPVTAPVWPRLHSAGRRKAAASAAPGSTGVARPIVCGSSRPRR